MHLFNLKKTSSEMLDTSCSQRSQICFHRGREKELEEKVYQALSTRHDILSVSPCYVIFSNVFKNSLYSAKSSDVVLHAFDTNWDWEMAYTSCLFSIWDDTTVLHFMH